MIYPEEFKKRCKEIYPWHKELPMYLEKGDRVVGRILKEGIPTGNYFDVVLKATSLEELKEIARIGKEREELYQEWKRLDNANRYRIYKS